MVFKKNNKGQAAIEFLMTYGWMLLVVLIVGALIFSFVDFGSLLPNKLDLSNDLRGSPSESLAYSNEYTGDINDRNEVRIIFTYTGAKQAQLNYTAGVIETNLGDSCYSYYVRNLDTNSEYGCDNAACVLPLAGSPVPFLNGQVGMMAFTCDNTPDLGNAAAGPLLKNDIFEGEVAIKVSNPKTGLDVVSSGPVRIGINQ